ncbi:MAG TPA: hypothetical protein DCP69_10475 [Candidatus Omnitrophica bacterium]|nr:hypothetical protein [Candidatus Omnitrophota bacterium]
MSKVDTIWELQAMLPNRDDAKRWGRLKQAERDLLDRLRYGTSVRQCDIDRLRSLVARLEQTT